jgi:phage-related holin
MTLESIATYKYSITAYLGLIALFEYLDIPQLQADILAYLMLIDFISGIAKQARVNYKEITSYKAWI